MPLKKSNNGNICGQKHRDQDKTQAPAKLIASGTRDADFDGGIIGVLLHGTGLPSSYIWVEWLELLMANGLKVRWISNSAQAMNSVLGAACFGM